MPTLRSRCQNKFIINTEGLAPTDLQGMNGKPKPDTIPKLLRRLEKLTLVCLWNDCKQKFDVEDEYIKHVDEHIYQLADPSSAAAAPPDSRHCSVLRCQWEQCAHVAATRDELRRHVLYHAYQVKLLSLGSSVVSRSAATPCLLPSTQRHSVPPVTQPFKCEWDGCGIKFDEPQVFFAHVLYHVQCCYYHGRSKVKTETGPFRCHWIGCTMETTRSTHLAVHVRSHTQEKLCACPTCGSRFSCNQRLYDHCLRQAPAHEQRFQCSHCQKCFPTERVLRTHIRSHINSYRCELCGLTLTSAAQLKTHHKFRHSTVRDFHCKFCNKGFVRRQDLAVHEKIHLTARHSCPVVGCSYSVNTERAIKLHYRYVHAREKRRRYACHLCDATYAMSLSMTRHLRRVHQLTLPEGHVRFRYKLDPDGMLRLQMLRFESLALAVQMGLREDPAGGGAAAPPEDGAAAQPDDGADPDDPDDVCDGSAATAAAAAGVPEGPEPDVLALTCRGGDVPDSIVTDDGRQLQLPETVQRALSTGACILVCVQGDQVQLLAHTNAPDGAEHPDDPGALMLVVDNPDADNSDTEEM